MVFDSAVTSEAHHFIMFFAHFKGLASLPGLYCHPQHRVAFVHLAQEMPPHLYKAIGELSYIAECCNLWEMGIKVIQVSLPGQMLMEDVIQTSTPAPHCEM